MTGTVNYSPGKLLGMAAVCAFLLPLLSPVMLLTGPGAIVLLPLFLFGGPLCAVPCVLRALGDRRAVQLGHGEVRVRTLWRTVVAPVGDLVDVRVERDTVRWMLLIPVATRWYLVVVLGDDVRLPRTFRLPFNLLDLDERGGRAFAAGAAPLLRRRPAAP